MFSIEDPDGKNDSLPSSLDIQYIRTPCIDMAKLTSPAVHSNYLTSPELKGGPYMVLHLWFGTAK